MGFSFDISTERCECDVLMNSKLLTIRDCNINNQSILRPANSWISADTHNNSYVYHLSPSCPFHYCLPNSSYLNFPPKIHNVGLIGLVYCADNVKKP